MSDPRGDACGVAESATHPPIASGIVYTFIHEKFEDTSILPRNGALEDFSHIERCFTSLGLTVMEPYIDYTAHDVTTVLREASQSNYSDYDCLVVIVITHYQKYGRFMTKLGCYYEDEVIDFFKGDKCKGLVTKPKIFMFQSSKCQELRTDARVKHELTTDSAPTSVPFTLPTEADILTLRSSYEGGPSHQPENTGSWAMQQLCKQLANLTGTTTLKDALTVFSNDVKLNRVNTNSPYDNKYMPEVTSTLIQPVFFKNPSLQIESNSLQSYKRYKKMGRFFIFNYNNVWDKAERGFLERSGTDVDAKSLESCFTKLGFEVIRRNDLPKEDVFRVLLSANDFAEDTCVAVAVLTHGIDGMLGSYDIAFSEEELYKPFSDLKQPHLVGKPKLFFLQVCRGDKVTGSVQVDDRYPHEPTPKVHSDEGGQVETDAGPMVVELKKCPDPLDEDDILVFHSTYAGTPSHRHSKFGSWFIQRLCKVLENKTQPFSLVHALSEVQRDVATNEEENIANELHKQMPVLSSTLTKSLVVSGVTNL